MLVVRKFIQILAVETGNFAMKVLPYGGIYLLGGVANGIAPLLTD
jgi:glucokinase